MSGAWERERPSVLVCILTREIVSMKWAMGLRGIALPPMSGVATRAGGTFDTMRNSACEDALRLGFQWLMFIDDDVIPPPDVFARLAGHNKDIVSGLYLRRQEPICPVAQTINPDGSTQWVTTWDPPECIAEVDLVGAGCLLIHRRVLEGMAKPWFDWELGRKTPAELGRPAMSEDFSFCVRAKQAGFKIYLDTSTRCEHVGLGQSSMEGGFRPCTL